MPPPRKEDADLARILAVNLRRARLKRKLIQRQVAAELDVDSMRVSDWERGTVSPQAVTLHRLARLYDVPMDILFVEDHPSLPEVSDGQAGVPEPPRPRSSKPKIVKPH